MSKHGNTHLFLTILLIMLSGVSLFAHGQNTILNESIVPEIVELEQSMFEIDLEIGVFEGDDNYVFGNISDVCVASDGEIFVLDRGFRRIQVYGPDGLYKRTIGREGEGPGEFSSYPVAITFSADGEIFVLDRYKVIVLSKDGQYRRQFSPGISGSGLPRSIVVKSNGDVVLTCYDVFKEKVVHVFDKEFNFKTRFGEPYSKGLEEDVFAQSMFAGGRIALDEEENIIYTQSSPYEIRRYDKSYNLATVILRENDFMPSPRIERAGQGYRPVLTPFAISILSLPGNEIMNVVKMRSDENRHIGALVEIFSGEGVLKSSQQIEGNINIVEVDAEGRFYIVDSREYIRLIRAERKEQLTEGKVK